MGSDIIATFNSDIDNNPNCLGDGMTFSNNWYYSVIKETPPSGTQSFYDVVLHEIGHGLGFSSAVNDDGSLFGSGFPVPDPNIDIYSSFLEDHSTGELWGDPGMTDAERVASAIDTGDLHWTGTAVTAAIATLTAGVSNGHVQMFAPDPRVNGSSVGHWDTAIAAGSNNELMEPFATTTSRILITDELLEDIGWGPTLPVELQYFEID